MPSPFPGMDPYLEPHWLDVHTALIAEARRMLNRSLPAGLVARAEERIADEPGEERLRLVGANAGIVSPSTVDPSQGAGGVVIEAPYKLVVEVDPLMERFIRVIDDAGQLITTIEFISPTNKRQPGLEAYRDKRAELLTGGVHVVEVDLVRAGDWRALMRPEVCPAEASTLYRAIVRTSGRSPGAYLFPIALGEPLPEIPIPLRPADLPARLPLQSLLNAVYDDGRYEVTIDYAQPLAPPLGPEDAGIAERVLSTTGRR